MVSLIINTFNRFDYVKQCFDSIKSLTINPELIIIVDDKSTEEGIGELVGDLVVHFTDNPNIHILFIPKLFNTGIRDSLHTGIEAAIELHTDIFINLDADSVVKPDFIERLVELKKQHPHIICSGFNAISSVNPIIKKYEDYCVKGYVNGINTCFNKEEYKKYIKPALLKEGNWDYNTSLACREDNLPFFVTRPSVVQHIGLISSMGHGHGVKADQAYDY